MDSLCSIRRKLGRPSAPGGFDCPRWHFQSRRRFFRQAQIGAAILASIHIILAAEHREQSNRYLHMALSTDPVPDESDSLLSSSAEAFIMLQDLDGNGLLNLLSLAGTGGTELVSQLQSLELEQGFENLLHG